MEATYSEGLEDLATAAVGTMVRSTSHQPIGVAVPESGGYYKNDRPFAFENIDPALEAYGDVSSTPFGYQQQGVHSYYSQSPMQPAPPHPYAITSNPPPPNNTAYDYGPYGNPYAPQTTSNRYASSTQGAPMPSYPSTVQPPAQASNEGPIRRRLTWMEPHKDSATPWAMGDKKRIVHTLEANDVKLLSKYKFGTFLYGTQNSTYLPVITATIPRSGGRTETVWRCNKTACKLCASTSGPDGYTDLSETVAYRHEIGGRKRGGRPVHTQRTVPNPLSGMAQQLPLPAFYQASQSWDGRHQHPDMVQTQGSAYDTSHLAAYTHTQNLPSTSATLPLHARAQHDSLPRIGSGQTMPQMVDGSTPKHVSREEWMGQDYALSRPAPMFEASSRLGVPLAGEIRNLPAPDPQPESQWDRRPQPEVVEDDEEIVYEPVDMEDETEEEGDCRGL